MLLDPPKRYYKNRDSRGRFISPSHYVGMKVSHKIFKDLQKLVNLPKESTSVDVFKEMVKFIINNKKG